LSAPYLSTPIPDLKIASSRYHSTLHGLLGLLAIAALVQIAVTVSLWPALLLTVPVWELWQHARRQALEGAVLRLSPGRWQLSLVGQVVSVRPSRRTILLPFCVRLILLEDRVVDPPRRARRWSCIVFHDSADAVALCTLRRQLNQQARTQAS
jgi:hypothetical protein